LPFVEVLKFGELFVMLIESAFGYFEHSGWAR